MKKSVLFSVLILNATIANSQTAQLIYDPEKVKSECSTEWGNDFQMVKYCIDQRASGHKEFGDIVARVTSSTDLGKAMGNCESEWGNQWDMVAYCGNQQLQGAASVAQLIKELPSDLANTIVGGCTNDWGVDFSMIAYCAKNQYAAWKSLNN